MKYFKVLLVSAILSASSLLAQESHYIYNNILIKFDGKSTKFIAESSKLLFNDVDLEDYREEKLPTGHNLTIANAQIIISNPKSKTKRFKLKDAIFVADRSDYVLASDAGVYSWDLGKIDPGDELYFNYESSIKEDYWGGYFSVIESIPVDSSKITIEFPHGKWRLKYSIDNNPIQYTDDPKNAVFIWHKLQASTRPELKNAPADVLPGIWISFESLKNEKDYSDWNDVNEWAAERFDKNGSFMYPDSMLAIARTPESILSAIAAKCHYVAIEIAEGGYVPSPSDDVWSKGYGDCKGLAMLFVNWMKAAGFKAWPVLVLADRSRIGNELFPSPYQFNHAIAAYEMKDGDTSYQDITAEYCPLGYLPRDLFGSLAFPISSNSKPILLGTFPDTPDTISFTISGDLDNSGTLTGILKARIEGEPALRLNWLNRSSKTISGDEVFKSFLEHSLPKASCFNIKRDSTTNSIISFSAKILQNNFSYIRDNYTIFRPWQLDFFNRETKIDSSLTWKKFQFSNQIVELKYEIRVANNGHSNSADSVIEKSFNGLKYSTRNHFKGDSVGFNMIMSFTPQIMTPPKYWQFQSDWRTMIKDISNISIK